MPAELPSLRVSIAGQLLYGAVAVRIEQPAYFRASRFQVTLAMGRAPLWDHNDYVNLSLQTITLELAQSPFNFYNLMTGQIDNVRIDLATRTAIISGRDLSARLIDTETAETFVNQTASNIAGDMAVRHGLASNIVPTKAMIGQYYELDHAHTGLQVNSRAGNNWDLLVWLAQNEGYVVSVGGTTLYFGPLPVIEPRMISLDDCIELSADLALTVSGAVTVKSWNTRNKSVIAQSVGTGIRSTNLVKPNLSSAQAIGLANGHLTALSQQIKILDLKIPGELSFVPAAPFYLTGTNSSLDQVYVIEEIVRELDMENGFTETIRAFAMN